MENRPQLRRQDICKFSEVIVTARRHEPHKRSLGRAILDRGWLTALGRGRFRRLCFSAEFVGQKLTLRFAFVPSKSSPARRTLIRCLAQPRFALRAHGASIKERARKKTDGTEEQAQEEARQSVLFLAGNGDSATHRCEPRPDEVSSHHAHPFSTHIISRIGPATRQALRSRAIRCDGFMWAEDAREGAECQITTQPPAVPPCCRASAPTALNKHQSPGTQQRRESVLVVLS